METVKIVFDIDSKDVKTTTEELKALNKVTNEEVKALDNLSQSAEDAGDGFVSLRSQVRKPKKRLRRQRINTENSVKRPMQQELKLVS